MSTRRKLGSKQAYCVIHQPVSMVSQCSLIAWLNGLASGDQRRLTGSGSALELEMITLYKSMFIILCFTNITYTVSLVS